MPVQNPQVFIVMLADAEGDLDPLLRLRRDGKEPQKLLALASVILPLKGGLLRTPPIRDGRKALAPVINTGGPPLQGDGGQDLPPLNTIGGYLKVRPAHVLAHGEEKVVPLETHVGPVAPDFSESRIHIHIGAARNLCERRPGKQVPAEIQQQIGAASQLLEFPPAHPEVVLALVVVHAAAGLNAKLARSLRESVQHVLQAVGILQRIDGPQMVYPETLHSHSLPPLPPPCC